MIKDTTIRAYALKNAVAHDGKAMPGPVISSLFNEGLKKEDMKKYGKLISNIIKEVNSLDIEKQKIEFEKIYDLVSEREVREGLEELPNAKKGVVMRFAPSPSGPMHIGHAATACISFLYVKKYGGEFYMRIEDTNPENIYKPAYKMLEDESKWLFDGIAKVVVQSDRMKLYYNYAEKLIKKKAVYVCTCPSETTKNSQANFGATESNSVPTHRNQKDSVGFKEFVENKKNCPCRKNSVKENMEKWKKMLDKTSKGFKEGEAVVRFKTPGEGMKHKNPAMRDFPLARINETAHPRQGKKYKVWPLMNLAVAVDDIEMKMTHIIRAKDHRDNAERQEMIFKVLGKKFPWTTFLGRWKFTDLELSASKMRKDIEAKKYPGWDDKRLPTIASLKKQGYKPQAFWKFAEQVGLSESDKVIDKEEYFKLLNSFNK